MKHMISTNEMARWQETWKKGKMCTGGKTTWKRDGGGGGEHVELRQRREEQNVQMNIGIWGKEEDYQECLDKRE